MELKGKLNSAGVAETFGSNGFTKRLFSIIVEDGKFPQTISFELHTNHLDIIDVYSVGGEITVTFDIRGRELPDGRVFNSLVCWKIAGEKSEGQPAYTGGASAFDAPDAPPAFDDFESDIPF